MLPTILKKKLLRNIFTFRVIILTTMVTILVLAAWKDLALLKANKFTESLTIQLKENYTRTLEKKLFSYEKILKGEASGSTYLLALNKKIIEYYTRDTWWDYKLCWQKKNAPIFNKVSDLMPLKTFNNAAFQNPDATIFLLTIIPFLEDNSGEIRRLLKSFPNIEILQADYDNLLQDTPLDAFKSRGIWTNNTGYLNAHMSDLLRVALIWKEGGTYLDSDIISVKKLPSRKRALMHGWSNISNGMIKGSKHHEYLYIVMNYQKTSYKATSWGSIGPEATTKGVNLYCNMTAYKPGLCKDISILPTESFTPVYWNKANEMMKPHSDIDSKVLLNNSYGTHSSHAILGQRLNELGNDSLYDRITKEFCPHSYKNQVSNSKPNKLSK